MHSFFSIALTLAVFPLVNAVVAAFAALALWSRTVFDVTFAPTHWFSQIVARALISDDALTVFAFEGFLFIIGVGAMTLITIFGLQPGATRS